MMIRHRDEVSPYFTAARLMIDGILDPRETRKTLIAGLEMAANNPEVAEFKTGVMRM